MSHFWELWSQTVRADFSKNMLAGEVEKSKRAFVSALRCVGEAVGLNVACKREGSDKAVLDVNRRLAKVSNSPRQGDRARVTLLQGGDA